MASVTSNGTAVTAALAQAIVHRAAALFGVDGDVDVDVTTSFFAPDGFNIGNHPFDSMDIVELLITLGEDVDVPLLDIMSDDGAETLAELAAIMAASARPDVVGRFTDRWV